jgi:hypothetical protein
METTWRTAVLAKAAVSIWPPQSAHSPSNLGGFPVLEERWQMTGADLIVAAPWIAFGIALLGLCLSPLLARRAARRRRERSARSRDETDDARGPRGPVRR